MQEISERIAKDIVKFNANVKVLNEAELDEKEVEILRMAKDYCEDAKSWLDKKEFYNAFASVSYAHGLLDSLLKLNNKS
jgi:hypothetical protein